MPLTVIQRPAAGSDGAWALHKTLNIRTIKGDQGIIPGFDNVNLVVWGCSVPPVGMLRVRRVLNPHAAIPNATNKIRCLRLLGAAGVPHLRFTTFPQVAQGWLDESKVVLARLKVASSKGQGIVKMTKQEDMVVAPLYTLFEESTSEWRVHAFKDGHTLIAKKALREGQEEENLPLRNHGDRYTFKYKDIAVDPKVRETAVEAIQALGLDFGGVDMLYHKPTGKATVIEVNTAPGLDHSVPLEWYAERLQAWISE